MNNIDYRLKQLSYSGRTTLHRCPRKYQLSKIAKHHIERQENVTLVFGSTVGIGIQSLLENKSWNQVVLDMLAAWTLDDLYAEEEKPKKSFWTAIFAVQQFNSIRNGALAEYELAYFKEAPAVELSFRITLMDEFMYRGFVDVVLQHKDTKQFIVLEIKTTGFNNVNAATYKNSSQAIGYSIILDTIAPNQSEYEVWYLVYKTTAQEYEILPFRKHYSDRAFWIKELIMDVQRIQHYEEEGRYPSYGESCFDFFRECEFFSNCQMSTGSLALPFDTDTDTDQNEYLLELSLLDLIDAQLNRQEI